MAADGAVIHGLEGGGDSSGFGLGMAGGLALALVAVVSGKVYARIQHLVKDCGDTEAVEKGRLFPLRLAFFCMLCTAVVLGSIIAAWSFATADSRVPVGPPNHTVVFEGHKDLWPLGEADWIGFPISAIALMLAAGGGIGGGGIIVPIYILVLGFEDKRAIPLSNLTILGGSIANCIMNWRRRHPAAGKGVDRPLIDFDLALAMEPLTIAGAILGALINKLLPGLVVTLMLVVVLGLTAQRTLARAKKLWDQEAKQVEEAHHRPTTEAEYLTTSPLNERTPLVPDVRAGSPLPGSPFVDISTLPAPLADQVNRWNSAARDAVLLPAKQRDALTRIVYGERDVPWDKISGLAVLFAGTTAMNVLKGGPRDPQQNPLWISCGDWPYWLLLLAQLPWCFVVQLVVRKMLLRAHAARTEAGYNFKSKFQFVWDDTSTIKYPIICSIAGLCAGLFGIGGGIVKGPLMLEMGVMPEVAGATAAFMILFTSASATSSYALFGMLTADYGAVMIVMGFVCTLIGQLTVTAMIKKAGRPSLVAWVIGGTVAASTVFMGIRGIMETYQELASGRGLWTSTPYCPDGYLYEYKSG
eukprot:TRINITY_DN1905_c0_g1_i3.p1 TRINITY_DN1905_c0_g1~~TRINITY_DN1905_c0_g1_i3.p1  ORF type:complete len:611 (+),score=201.38 TRINITY_DN1905_c0_g1_i3:82-1833(+)